MCESSDSPAGRSLSNPNLSFLQVVVKPHLYFSYVCNFFLFILRYWPFFCLLSLIFIGTTLKASFWIQIMCNKPTKPPQYMLSAKMTSMTFTLSNQMSGWCVEQKSQRENSRKFTHSDQTQHRPGESPSKSYSGQQSAVTRESSE